MNGIKNVEKKCKKNGRKKKYRTSKNVEKFEDGVNEQFSIKWYRVHSQSYY